LGLFKGHIIHSIAISQPDVTKNLQENKRARVPSSLEESKLEHTKEDREGEGLRVRDGRMDAHNADLSPIPFIN
jgi:hypothetical protein